MVFDMKIVTNVEIRESSKGVKRVYGVLVQEGRAARGGRAEVFAPQSIMWPDGGIRLLGEHRGASVGSAHPARHPNGEIRISTPATRGMIEAIEAGKTGLSVEFQALKETRTAGGVREIERALVDAAAFVRRPEYEQGRAEIRSKSRRNILWRI